MVSASCHDQPDEVNERWLGNPRVKLAFKLEKTSVNKRRSRIFHFYLFSHISQIHLNSSHGFLWRFNQWVQLPVCSRVSHATTLANTSRKRRRRQSLKVWSLAGRNLCSIFGICGWPWILSHYLFKTKKSMGKPWAASIIKHQSIPPNIAPYLTSKINNFSAKPRFPVAVWELPGGGRSGSEGPLSGHGYHLRLPALWVGATLAAAAATALLGDVDAGSKC